MTPREHADALGIDEQEHIRRFLLRLSDWDGVQVYRDGKLLGPLIEPGRAELRKRIFKLPWNRPRR